MKKCIRLPVMLLVVVLAVAACDQPGDVDTEQSDAGVVPVETVIVTKRTLRHVLSYTGILEAWQELEIVPNISGKVARILVEEGDSVRKDDVLAELDTESMELGLKQAHANLHAAEAAFSDAERNKNRMSQLIRDNTISPQQYEKAELAYDSTAAQLEQARTAVEMAEYNLRVSVMKAPFDGVVTHKHLNEGDTINPMMPGSSGVVTLMDFSTIEVRIRVPDTDLRFLRPGLTVVLGIDAYPGETFEGSVYTVNPAAVRQSRMFEVRLKIQNRSLKLKPGMFARVDVVADVKKDVSVIPSACIVSIDSVPTVFVVANGAAKQREVMTGIADGEYLEIVSGLDDGETVVSVGQLMLEDGIAVIVKGGESE